MKKVLFSLLIAWTCSNLAKTTTFTVSTLNNSGVGSLRQAILDANADNSATPASPHLIDATGVTGTISVTIDPANSLFFLVITNHMTIKGSGQANLTISGNGTNRIFWIQNGTVTLQDLTIADGFAKGGTGGGGGMGAGGAIFMHEGKQDPVNHTGVLSGHIDLQLVNVTLKDNKAIGGTGSSFAGGGGLGGNGAATGGGGVLGTGGGDAGGSVTNGSGSTPGTNGGIVIFGKGGKETPSSQRIGGFGGGGYIEDGGFGGGGSATVLGGGSFGRGGFGGGGGSAGTDNGFQNNGGAKGGFGGGGGGLTNRTATSMSPDGGIDDGQPGFGAGQGTTIGGGGMGAGGAIFVCSGKLTLMDVTFENNMATGGTGGNPGKGLGGALFIFNKTDNDNNAAPGTTNDPQVWECNVTYTGNTASDDAATTTNNDHIYGSTTTLPSSNEISDIELKPNVKLWPPDRSYITFTMADMVASLSGNCSSSMDLNIVWIQEVSSDEAEDAPGVEDGNTLNDFVIASDCRSVKLRRERISNGNGRVYTVTLAFPITGGGTGNAEFIISVPKWAWGSGSVATADAPAYVVTGNCTN